MNASQHADCYNEVQADIARMESELTELRAVAKWHLSRANANGAEVPQDADNPTGVVVRPRVRLTGPYTRMKQIDAAEEVLRKASEPLNTKIIAQHLLDGGFVAKDLKKLTGSLFTGMKRRPDTFAKAGPGMWTLVSRSKDTQ
jgi:hypothetical protein